MVHGLGKTFAESLEIKMQRNFFSLNIDESTSNNMTKVLAILVSYFSEEKNEVVVEHLASVSMIKVDSVSLFKTLENIFHEKEIPWKNLMSVLLDSCNVMRGKKSGLETRLREGPAPHLLDVDGDSVHHAHNAAKAFAKPFKSWLEGLFADIHTGFKWSPDLKEALAEICEILGVKFTAPERFLSHRFLSAFNLAVDTNRLLDAYTLFYFAFIKERREQVRYQHIVLELQHKKNLSAEAVKNVQVPLSKKKMTADGVERKERIINCLFYSRKRTRMLLGIYVSVLEQLKAYAMLIPQM